MVKQLFIKLNKYNNNKQTKSLREYDYIFSLNSHIYVLYPDPASITEVFYSLNSGNKINLTDGQDIQARESENIVLACLVDAEPLATVILLHRENNVISSKENTTILSTEYREVTCDQTGNYTFKALNIVNNEPATHTFEMKVLCMYKFPLC